MRFIIFYSIFAPEPSETYVLYSKMKFKWEEIDELLNISSKERNRVKASVF